MKAFKLIVLILIVMVLFQSCYTRKLTVDQYIQPSHKQRKLKIKTVDDEWYKYKYIYVKDSTLYGVKRLYPKKQYGGNVITLDLSQIDIELIKEYSPGRTTLLVIPIIYYVLRFALFGFNAFP